MDKMDFIGPRLNDVVVRGRDVFGRGSQWINPYGQPGITIHDRHIGTISGLPFDNTVKDFNSHIIGTLEGPLWGRKTLRRW